MSSMSLSYLQRGDTALLLAAFGGSIELAKMLLDEFGSTVDEVNNVSVVENTTQETLSVASCHECRSALL